MTSETQISQRLKPERIQSHSEAETIQNLLDSERAQRALPPERIQALLDEAPGWSPGESGGLSRTYGFPTARAAGLFVQLVAAVGGAAGHVPEVRLRNLEVTVTVTTAQGGGATELDVRLARLLDSRL